MSPSASASVPICTTPFSMRKERPFVRVISSSALRTEMLSARSDTSSSSSDFSSSTEGRTMMLTLAYWERNPTASRRRVSSKLMLTIVEVRTFSISCTRGSMSSAAPRLTP